MDPYHLQPGDVLSYRYWECQYQFVRCAASAYIFHIIRYRNPRFPDDVDSKANHHFSNIGVSFPPESWTVIRALPAHQQFPEGL